MEDKIKEAMKLLRENGYTIIKLSERMKKDADKCATMICTDCALCTCNVCIMDVAQ